MSQPTFYSGSGVKLAAGLQINPDDYFSNIDTDVTTKLNITSATFDPAVEKVSEETLLQSKVKNGSLLTSITVDGSFDANLRPEMTDWIFAAACQQESTTSSTTAIVVDGTTVQYDIYEYELANAGIDPLGSTLVLTRSDNTSDVYTYPGMTVRSMTMTMPNNDFVTVSMDLAGREEIRHGSDSKISVNYVEKSDDSDEFTKPSYIVTKGVFEWEDVMWCIESSTLTIDNGIEDSPRCYQDGLYVNIPVMGMRSITFDFNLPYTDRIETLKKDYLLNNAYGKAEVEFTNANDPNEKVNVIIPNLSITSVSAGISGTGVVEASVSGEAVADGGEEPITIIVQTKHPEN